MPLAPPGPCRPSSASVVKAADRGVKAECRPGYTDVGGVSGVNADFGPPPLLPARPPTLSTAPFMGDRKWEKGVRYG